MLLDNEHNVEKDDDGDFTEDEDEKDACWIPVCLFNLCRASCKTCNNTNIICFSHPDGRDHDHMAAFCLAQSGSAVARIREEQTQNKEIYPVSWVTSFSPIS